MTALLADDGVRLDVTKSGNQSGRPVVLLAGFKAPATSPRHQLRPLCRAAAPVLLAGGADSEYRPAAHRTTAATIAPRGGSVVLPNDGYAADIEQPRAFDRAVLRFLQRTGGPRRERSPLRAAIRAAQDGSRASGDRAPFPAIRSRGRRRTFQQCRTRGTDDAVESGACRHPSTRQEPLCTRSSSSATR